MAIQINRKPDQKPTYPRGMQQFQAYKVAAITNDNTIDGFAEVGDIVLSLPCDHGFCVLNATKQKCTVHNRPLESFRVVRYFDIESIVLAVDNTEKPA